MKSDELNETTSAIPFSILKNHIVFVQNARHFQVYKREFSMQLPSCDFSDLSLSSHDIASVGVRRFSVIKLIVAPHAFTQKQLFIIPEGAYPPQA
jgi:hypothetical protein